MSDAPLLFDRLREDCGADWKAYVHHDFVAQLGDGSLRKEAFAHYLKQDYLFLIQFARARALGVFKAATLADMRSSLANLSAIVDEEMDLHVTLCGEWGIAPDELEALPEARATVAYTRFVLDAGQRGDLLDLAVTLAPCTVGYGEIGARLMVSPDYRPDHPYAAWIEAYGGEEYQSGMRDAIAEIERLGALSLTEARYPRLLALFRQATQLEADFWQMGLDLAD